MVIYLVGAKPESNTPLITLPKEDIKRSTKFQSEQRLEHEKKGRIFGEILTW